MDRRGKQLRTATAVAVFVAVSGFGLEWLLKNGAGEQERKRAESFGNAISYLAYPLMQDRNGEIVGLVKPAENICGVFNARFIVQLVKSQNEIETLGQLPLYKQVECGPGDAVTMADVFNSIDGKRKEIIEKIQARYAARSGNASFIAFQIGKIGCSW